MQNPLDSFEKNRYIRLSGYIAMTKVVDHQVFKALSEPVRLRIAVLLTEGELCVCDLTHVLSLPQSTVSRHMARLRTAGLTESRRSGRWIHYKLRLDSSAIGAALKEYLRSARSIRPFRSDLTRLAKHRDQRICE